MNPFEILVANLNQLGFFGFLLPWLLTFAVVFGLLSKTKALGEDLKINGVIALVVAFFVIGFGGPALGTFFVNLFGWGAVVLAVILVIVLFLAMTGADVTKVLGGNVHISALLVGIGIIIVFITIGAFGVKISTDVLAAVFVIIVMGIAVMFIGNK